MVSRPIGAQGGQQKKPLREAVKTATLRRYTVGWGADFFMNRTILVVDDDQDTLLLLQTMLATKGFSVVTARSGAEALQAVQRSAPALVLLDVMMPEMNGYEVLERLKGNHATSRVPVILVTAKGHDDDVMTGYQYGADYYITKPYTSKQLLFGVELVLGRADLPPAENA